MRRLLLLVAVAAAGCASGPEAARELSRTLPAELAPLYLRRPDAKQNVVTAFQREFNSVYMDLLREADAKAELLLRADEPASDRIDLWVMADEAGTSARLVARLDNLGKGAAGAAVQSLNLMAGCDPLAGLRV